MIKIILKNKAPLNEMPIVGVTKAGTRNRPSSEHGFEQSFKEQDLKFINNTKAIGKVVKMWAGSKIPLNLVFSNLPKTIVNKHKKYYYSDGGEDFGDQKITNQTIGGDANYYSVGMGLEQPGFLGKHRQRSQYFSDEDESRPENMDDLEDDEEYNYSDDPEVASELIGDILKFSNYKRNNEAINFIVIGNWGDGKVPLSGWIIAHKLSHALLDASNDIETIKRLISLDFEHTLEGEEKERFNNKGWNSLGEVVLPTITTKMGILVSSKSGRDNKISNLNEAFHELFAYYVLNNRLKFSTSGIESVANSIVVAAQREIEKERVLQIVEFYRQRLEFYFQHILESAIGSTLID